MCGSVSILTAGPDGNGRLLLCLGDQINTWASWHGSALCTDGTKTELQSDFKILGLPRTGSKTETETEKENCTWRDHFHCSFFYVVTNHMNPALRMY